MAVSLRFMEKIRKLQPRSFAHLKEFPGCIGNPFDLFLHSMEDFERVPAPILSLILIFLALLGSLPDIIQARSLTWMTSILLAFFISDWILMALLPETRRSFGPVKVVVLMLALLRVPFAWLPFGWDLGFEIAGTLLVIHGFFIEPFRLDVHHETFISNKLSHGKGVRVLHFGDLHMERTTSREVAVLKKIRELEPDLILFSGDVLNLSYLMDGQAQSDAIDFFSQLSAPLGVYGVTGSPCVDSSEFFAGLCRQTSLQWLRNETAVIDTPVGKINLCGITCSHKPDLDEQVMIEMEQRSLINEDGLNLLLYHSPDLSPNASRFGVDLQLSGHTHGGQIRLPVIGALFTGALYGRLFESGRYLVNSLTLYITRGLGMEGAIAPRVRLLCPPEIILWQINGN